jgi:uncharacterized protein
MPLASLQPPTTCQDRYAHFNRQPGGRLPVTGDRQARVSTPTVALCAHEPGRADRSAEDIRRRSPRERRAGLFIFGSRAVGTPRPDSDLDLFIDYDPEAKIPNMFRLMQIEEDMSKALGVPVTITTRNALHPLMKENIERDAIRIS